MEPGAGSSSGAPAAPAPKKGALSVEKMYQKKSQLEHVLLRPDTYIGSVEPVTEQMWVYDTVAESMVQRDITYVPGLYKIFDEILVNAADNKQRDPKMNCIKITINAEENEISIWNNGQGIPVVEHKDEKMFVPTMIFGHLLTSSNYNDEEEKVTGGRNGYGAKLCNIFSTKFTVETSSSQYKNAFKQTWMDNMSKAGSVKIKPASGDDFTKITFCPDLSKFKMEKLDKDTIDLLSRRAYDVAASTRGIKVFLNGTRLPVSNFKDYVQLYLKDKEDDTGQAYKVSYENVSDRWEVALTTSDRGFQQVSFVNSIATTKGGRHVDYVTDALIKNLIEQIKKKNKGGMTIKPFQVKSHMWIFINCLIVNPTFDSQTKENMTLQAKNFGSKCTLSDKFLTQVAKSGLVEQVLTWAKFKAQTILEKAGGGKKKSKLRGIPKLDDANDAGTKNSLSCTLILTEGDSAKALAVSGLGVIGRDKYGVFPLRGKLLNVREASHKQILENAEINNIIKIVGLKYKMKYETREDLETLRYGKIMIMTDQDQDGSHIKGLIVNFIHHNWPSLIKTSFLEVFITPIVKATKRNNELSFYSIPEFDEWRADTPDHHTYRIKYYKGLGTSSSKEAKEYFSNMERHRIKFKYTGAECDQHIIMAFSKKCVEQRKEWLTNWMVERKRRKELGLPEEYLYAKDTKSISFKDFINKELVLFSNADNERSIPSAVDGLKPGQRKVLFVCLKRNDSREVRVAQLAGSVAEHSAYHHGEVSLMATIINLAQNYVGTNNINLLQPLGQFGTRLQGGKDAASPRYIFTMLSPLARLIFHPHDDPLLKYQKEDNQRIEPVWYIPVIPMLLVNGADGIGTGWMTKIPNYNPREIIDCLLEMIDGKEPSSNLKPWYKNFRGDVESLIGGKYVLSGEIAVLGEDKVEITELPIGVWTHVYKENVLEPMLAGNEKTKAPPLITDFKEYHTDTKVKFVVTMTKEKLYEAEKEGLHKFFKLQNVTSLTSMCAFDHNLCLRKFDSIPQILKEFFDLRLEFYGRRKAYLEGMLQAEANKLSAQARFIMEKCDGKLTIENKKKAKMIEELKNRGYPSDPVKEWKTKQVDKGNIEAEDEERNEDGDEPAPTSTNDLDYNYLLGMTMWTLTYEKKEELINKKLVKVQEYEDLKCKSPGDIWKEDIKALKAKLDEVEEQERAEESSVGTTSKKGKGGIPALVKGGKKGADKNPFPSPQGRRIKPEIGEELKKKAETAVRAKERKAEGGVAKRGRKKLNNEEKDEFDKIEDGAGSAVLERKAKSPKKREKADKEKSPKKKKKGMFSDSESEEEFQSGSDFESQAFSSKKSKKKSIEITPEKRQPRRSAAANLKFNFDSNSEDDWQEVKGAKGSSGDDSDSPVSGKGVPPVRNVDNFSDDSDDDLSHKKNGSSNKNDSDKLFDSLLGSGDDKPMTIDTSEDEKPAPKAKPAAKAPKEKKPREKKPAQPKRPKKKKAGSSDDDSDDNSSKPKKPAKKKKKADSSDDDIILNSENDSPPPPPRSGGRARKPAAYNISDSEGSDF